MNKYLILLLLCLFSFSINAQETEITKNTFKGTRFINSQSVNLAKKGELLMFIQHRFGDINGGGYEFFGLDQASMRIGFEYGFGKNFNLGFGRSTYLKTFDAFGKYRILQQSNNFPISIAITAGGSIPSIRNYFPEENDNFSDKISTNTQLHLATTIKNFGIQISPGYLHTGHLISQNKNFSIFTLGMGGSVKISKKVSANLEYLHIFNNKLSNINPLSISVDLDTGGHLFQLILSNSQRMFDQAFYTGTTGDWTKGSLFFGFNLIRGFNLKYYE